MCVSVFLSPRLRFSAALPVCLCVLVHFSGPALSFLLLAKTAPSPLPSLHRLQAASFVACTQDVDYICLLHSAHYNFPAFNEQVTTTDSDFGDKHGHRQLHPPWPHKWHLISEAHRQIYALDKIKAST